MCRIPCLQSIACLSSPRHRASAMSLLLQVWPARGASRVPVWPVRRQVHSYCNTGYQPYSLMLVRPPEDSELCAVRATELWLVVQCASCGLCLHVPRVGVAFRATSHKAAGAVGRAGGGEDPARPCPDARQAKTRKGGPLSNR